MKKRILSLLLTVALIFACLPHSVIAVETSEDAVTQKNVQTVSTIHDHTNEHNCEDCKDQNVTWIPWDNAALIPYTTGHYYLTTDVTVEWRTTISGSNNVVLCLNGYRVSGTGNDTLYQVQDTAKLTITDCMAHTDAEGKYIAGELTNGKQQYVGGLLYVIGQASFRMFGGKLTGGKNTSNDPAYAGGAIQGRGNASIYLKGVEVSENHTTGGGGAICLLDAGATGDTAASAFLEDVTFRNNKADNRGGAIYASSPKNSVTLKNCVFEDNSGTEGGAVNMNGGTLNVEGCTFHSNDGTEGGALRLAAGSTAMVTNCTFTENHATISGGAISSGESNLTLKDNTIRANVSDNTAGAIFFGGANKVLTIESDEISGNTAAKAGGAILVQSRATLEMKGGTLKNNETTGLDGGAVYISTNSFVKMSGGEISGNIAKGDGGGIYLYKGTLTLTGGNITDNTAGSCGGGICSYSADSKLNISGDPVVRQNTAAGTINNIYLPAEQIITLGDMVDGTGMIGVNAGVDSLPRFISTDMGSKDYSAYFFSDSPYRTISVVDNKLQLGQNLNHSHCDCANIGSDRCNHTQTFWIAWEDATQLPATEGHYYLTSDITVDWRTTISGNNHVVLCLNGHTVSATGNDTIYQVQDTAKLTITDCAVRTDEEGHDIVGQLTNGKQQYVGGLVYVIGQGSFEMLGGKLTGGENTSNDPAYAGGAIQGRGNANIYLKGVEVSGNHTTGGGGAICLLDTGSVYLEDVTFRNNKADNRGGAIYASSPKNSVTLKNCVFEDNSGTEGGAVNMNGGTLTAEGCTFHSNDGTGGGALRLAAGSTATVTDCTFTENHATISGGAISSGESNLTLKDNTIRANVSDNTAGAIFFGGADKVLTMESGEISGNTAAKAGGAILVQSGATLEMKDGTLKNNETTGLDGGAVYISTNSFVKMSGGEISGNIAKGDGGGIYLYKGTLTLTGGNITENTAGSCGGGICSYSADAKLNISGTPEVTANKAGGVFDNLYLQDGQQIVLGTMGEGTGKIGITADVTTLPRIISTDMGATDCSAYFFSDGIYWAVTVQDNKLQLGMDMSHRHCVCAGIGGQCDHAQNAWMPWEDSASLPYQSGYYYLTTDVTVEWRTTISDDNNVVLCLNGHTVSGTANDTIYQVQEAAKLTITDCTAHTDAEGKYIAGGLTNGKQQYVGGLIYVNGQGSFQMFGGKLTGGENTSNDPAYAGGAIQGRGNANIYLKGVEVSGNHTTGGGGAICLLDTGSVYLEDVTFRNNKADNRGGVIYASSSKNSVTLKNCVFEDNSGTEGGAVNMNGGTLMAEGCTFHSNDGTEGGALRLAVGSIATVTDCTFTENHATISGGAISSGDSNLTLKGNTIRANMSDNTAGAIFFGGANKVLTIESDEISGNTAAKAGGAILVQSGAIFNMKDGTISNNTTTGLDGGGVYISTNSFMNMSGGQISNNTAKGYGGGIYLLGSSFAMTGGQISGNTAPNGAGVGAGLGYRTVNGTQVRDVPVTVIISDGTIASNTASENGGGLLLSGEGAVLTINGGTISGNEAPFGAGAIAMTHAVIVMKDGTVSSNKASKDGGAFYISYTAELTVDGGELSQNSAQQDGGAIFLLGSNAVLNGGKIVENYAKHYGSALRAVAFTNESVQYHAKLDIKKGIISQNAVGDSGTIAVSATKLNMTGGEISGNTSANNASGVLIMSDSEMKMSGGTISGNSAANLNGGLFISSRSKFTMTGGSVSYNTCKSTGAGVYLQESAGSFYGGQITNNRSTDGAAGGVYVCGSTVGLHGTSVLNNYAKVHGGGVVTSRHMDQKQGKDIMPQLNITAGIISGNKSDGAAGGVLLMSPGVTTMSGGIIENNEAVTDGGGMYVSTKHTFYMTGGEVRNNKTGGMGGGIFHLNSTSEYTGGKITGNTSIGNGGGMMFAGDTISSLKNLEITDNAAHTAGAFAFNNRVVKITAENCNISRNTSTVGHGGAVYIVWGVTDSWFKNCTFADNHATDAAGAIYIANGADCDFTDCVFTGNAAGGTGGAMCSGSATKLTGCTFTDNTAGTTGGAISTNPAGAVNVIAPFLTLENCILSNNTAGAEGGALYLLTGTYGSVSNTTITGNTAGAEGGGIWAVDDTILHSVTITGNTSGGDGYALYYGAAEYDNISYYRGFHKISGEMKVYDNKGGDMYLGEETAIAVDQKGLTGDTRMEITLHSGLLTQLLYGAYNYEGSNQKYVVTAGDRSLTDPEFDASMLPQKETVEEPTEAPTDDDSQDTDHAVNPVIFIAGGIVVALSAAVAIIVISIFKKKKPAAGK